MNFYPFHIGDYAVHTRHLTLMEDLAYRRLLDWYYTHERHIPGETQSVSKKTESVARLIGMREHEAEVRAVLAEFFTPNDAGGWSNKRCDEEIEAARARRDRAKANGKSGGRPRKSGPSVADAAARPKDQEPRKTQPVNSGNPGKTKSKAPNTNTKGITTPPPPKGGGFLKFWSAYPDVQRKVARLQCWEKWRSRKLEPMTEQIVAHVEAMKGSAAWTKDKGAFIPSPLVYLNQQRWEGPIESEGQKVDPWSTRPGVEAIAAKHGLPRWDETIPFEDYRERVRAKVNESEETPA